MKYFFLVTAVLININIFSQNLSLNEIISLRKKNLADFEEYLNSRGWKFESSEKGKLVNSISFTFNKREINNRAESFIDLKFKSDYSLVILNIQISNQTKYNEYLTKVKSKGCKLIDSEITNDGIIKIYQGPDTTFRFEASKAENESLNSSAYIYFLTLFDTKDYNKIRK